MKLNKPIYAGFAILDLSKLHKYEFDYEVLKTKYDKIVDLSYTDTDSYVIEVRTEDLYEDLQQLNKYMDLSDYPREHQNYDPSNKT